MINLSVALVSIVGSTQGEPSHLKEYLFPTEKKQNAGLIYSPLFLLKYIETLDIGRTMAVHARPFVVPDAQKPGNTGFLRARWI
jgi:hypothetical protein|tara:strand:- start:778 stop:1029 length:252 start_codon:yes stop_codon:yes gene_type:complete